MFKFTKKIISVPNPDERIELEAAELWEVRWYSYHKTIIDSAEPSEEVEVFTTKVDAETFIHSLKAARKLLRDEVTSPSMSKRS